MPVRLGTSFDPDAASYFLRIAAAGSSISPSNAVAVDAFIKGCKADGIWSAIKASCILAGADTIAGALVPLVGTAPTATSFSDSDYNRITGLRGDVSSKRINTNRLASADPLDNAHIAIYTTASALNRPCTLAGNTNLNYRIYLGGSGIITRLKSTKEWIPSSTGGSAFGLIGMARNSSTQLVARFNNTTYTDSDNTGVQGPNENIFVFGQGTNSANVPVTFYSLGEYLNLVNLNVRLTTLMASLT